MSFFSDISFKRKLTLVVLVTSCAALILASAAFVVYDLIAFRHQTTHGLTTLAKIIGNNSTAALAFNDPQAATETLAALSAEPNIVGACIYTTDARIFARYGPAGTTFPRISPQSLSEPPKFEDGYLHLFRPIMLRGKMIGTIYLRYGLQELNARFQRYVGIVVVVMVAASCVAFLLSSRLQRVVSEPVLHLAKIARVVTTDKNYSIRATHHGRDEVGTLVGAFNEMLAQIQERDSALQRANDELEKRVQHRTEQLQQELTERRRTEQELEKSVSLLSATLESTADGLLVVDREGKIISMNRKFAAMWRLTEEVINTKDEPKIIGFVFGQLLDPEVFQNKIRELYSKPEAESYDILRFKDGRIFERYSQPQWMGGKIGGRVWSFRDVTERKRAEEEVYLLQTLTLAVSEAENLQASLGVALCKVCEATGWILGQAWTPSADETVLECSPAWFSTAPGLEMFREEARTRTFAPGVGLPGRVWATKKHAWIRDIKEEGNFPRADVACEVGIRAGIAFPVIAKDKVVAVIEFFVFESPREDGRLVRLVSTVAAQLGSVIERKQAEDALHHSEEQLRHAQKMEAVGRLAGGVAHDFNNILTVINGYSEVLLRRMDASDKNRRIIEEIQSGGERAAGLTRQLLAFSRKQVLQPKVLDLSSVVSGMEKMVRRLIGEDVELTTGFESALWKVKTDPGQIEQVILNLAVNARDAMPDGGDLTIETSNVVIEKNNEPGLRELDPGKYVMLVVTDTGFGMSDHVKTHLFEPFFTTKGLGKGTGLGLATCYGIVKQSGGNILVHSEVGKGTSMKVYLPAVEETSPADKAAIAVTELPRGSETILIVEDEPGVRQLVSSVLGGCGYRILESSNGAEGLTTALAGTNGKIDLVLTDVIMPVMGGKEMVQRIQVVHPKMRVLYTSGYTDDALAHRGVLDEGIAFLEKPFSPSGLAHKVREVLSLPQSNGSGVHSHAS